MGAPTRSPRFVMLFGLGLVVTLISFSLFFLNTYLDYSHQFVLLSPGEERPLFFTLEVAITVLIYSVVVVVLVLALIYSWRGYHALAPPRISRKEQLAELRKKSPFFKR